MREHDEIIKDIKTVLEEKVAPSVAAIMVALVLLALPATLGYFKIITRQSEENGVNKL